MNGDGVGVVRLALMFDEDSGDLRSAMGRGDVLTADRAGRRDGRGRQAFASSIDRIPLNDRRVLVDRRGLLPLLIEFELMENMTNVVSELSERRTLLRIAVPAE